jgi:hypothetical protein
MQRKGRKGAENAKDNNGYVAPATKQYNPLRPLRLRDLCVYDDASMSNCFLRNFKSGIEPG